MERLRSVELLPFARAAAAGLLMIMTAHVVFDAIDPGVPATLSRRVLGELLRGELAYRGVVVSDDLDMKAIADHGGAGDAAGRAVEAGCDALLLCRDRSTRSWPWTPWSAPASAPRRCAPASPPPPPFAPSSAAHRPPPGPHRPRRRHLAPGRAPRLSAGRASSWLAHIREYGYAVAVKTTIEIADGLLVRAKRHARKVGKPLRVLVEEGLRRVLDEEPAASGYELPDRAVGRPGEPNPLETLSWPDLRDEIYGGR
jgi:hypothetical protein